MTPFKMIHHIGQISCLFLHQGIKPYHFRTVTELYGLVESNV